jgi:hypothetical protein
MFSYNEFHERIDAARSEHASEPENPDHPENCPGCGCGPGDGITEGCNAIWGCGYYRHLEQVEQDEEMAADRNFFPRRLPAGPTYETPF